MVFFLIFVIIPLIEIALFAWLGGEIGVFPTLLLCVLTAIIGSILIKKEGVSTLFAAQKTLDRGGFPVKELFDGFCLVIAGVMLMTPGFFTDATGFSLLVPPVRDWLRHILPRYLDAGVSGQEYGKSPDKPRDRQIIDVEFERMEDQEDQDSS